MTRTTSGDTSDLEGSGFRDQIQNIDISESLSARPSHPAQETRRVRVTAGGSEDLGVSQN